MILPIIQFYENSCIVKLFTSRFVGYSKFLPAYKVIVLEKEKDYWNTNEAYDTFKSYLLDYLK